MIARGASLIAGLLVLSACTTSGGTTDSGAPPPVTSSGAGTSVVPSSPAPTETSTASTPSAPPSSQPATSASPSPSAAAAHTTCTSVDVRVIEGSASVGQEFAALQFINTGVKTCVLAGYPTATLFLDGKQIGQPSQPSSIAPSVRTLKPGDVAESKLHDYTDCQAPLSDSVKVQVPGLSTTATRPTQLRACVLRVDRLGAPD